METIRPIRKSHQLSILVTVLLTAAFLFTSSCKDKKSDDPQKPIISSIVDDEAYPGDTVTITGEHFKAGATETVVKFGAATATIITGTTTTIDVKVPVLDPSSVQVEVEVSKLKSNTVSFTVLNPDDLIKKMEFDDFNPKTGPKATEITIKGKNFDSNVEVFVNGVKQTDITLVDAETITVRIAAGTGTGKVVLKRSGEPDKENDTDYTYKYTTYTVSDYGTEKGIFIATEDDGTSYISYNKALLKLNSQGERIDTLIDFGIYPWPRGLFLANDGTLYIADYAGGTILSKKKNSDKIDTLVINDAKIPAEELYGITGDNAGYLYVTTKKNYTVVKIDIDKPEDTEVIALTASEKTYGITYNNDSLYVSTTNGLFKVHKDGGAINYIFEENKLSFSGLCTTNTGEVFVVGGEIYQNLFIVKDDNTLEEVVSNVDLGNFQTRDVSCTSDGSLYVISEQNLKKIVRD
jgi:hypothetical protein